MRRARRNLVRGAVATGGLMALAGNASAVIVFEGEGRNLAAPTGSLLTPWNLQGHFTGEKFSYNATPISPSHFISAAHTGGGSQLAINGGTYNVASSTVIAGTDLRVYTIDTSPGAPRFTAYARLWDPAVDGSEVGKPLAVFGRGTQRGAAIYAPQTPAPAAEPVRRGRTIVLTAGVGATTSIPLSPLPTLPGDLRGWAWSTDDRQLSWGQNVVDAVVRDNNYGDVLSFSFSASAGRVANEASLSGGDSGGGVFILSNGIWKLAGVNLGTDGSWSYTAAGPYVRGAVFDARGLYMGSAENHDYMPYEPGAVAGSSYSTRLASHLPALRSLIGGTGTTGGPLVVPEPGTLVSVAALAVLTLRRRER